METVTEKIICLVLMAALLDYAGATCNFPSTIQNYNWTSSNFGEMLFGVDSVNFTEDGATSWTCHLQDGDKYVIKSDQFILTLGNNGTYYYCVQLTMQNAYSYSYYLQTEQDGLQKRRKLLLASFTVTASSEICTETQNVASYYVMVRSDSPSSARQYCSAPLLGTFSYTIATAADPSTVLCGSYTGVTDVCDSSSRDILTFNLTFCSTVVAYSSSGVLNCIASVTSGDIYYQTLYNTDSSPTTTFVCIAASYGSPIDGVTSVYASYSADACIDGQNSTHASLGGGYLVMKTNATCPIESSDGSDNTALIVGVVIGLLLLIAIVVGLLVYFCWWKKRDPNDGKPIIENTKPRFVDPDKEDILEDLETVDARSAALTRDDIVIEANSPSFMPNMHNGKAMSMTNGLSVSPIESFSHQKQANGSLRRDSGLGTEKSSIDRPTPRMASINTAKESMVIFNGDEKVISGNDARIVPTLNQNTHARTLKMSNNPLYSGPLSLQGLEDELDDVGELGQGETIQYPTLPREKSNLMPPRDPVLEDRTPR